MTSDVTGKSQLFVATQPFQWSRPDGQPVLIHQGAVVRAGHPALADAAAFFMPLCLVLEGEDEAEDQPLLVATVVVRARNPENKLADGLQPGMLRTSVMAWQTRPELDGLAENAGPFVLHG